jgi:hypothetical protein
MTPMRVQYPYKWIAREILVNWIGYKLRVRSLTKRSVTNNVHWNVEEDVEEKGRQRLAYMKEKYRELGRVWPPRRVLEIGPGGTLLLGIHLLADGVKEYIGVDRFPSDLWSEHPQRCYDAALKTLPEPDRLRSAIEAARSGTGPLRYMGKESASAFASIEPGSIDLIFSWGALEHVEAPYEMFLLSRPLLSPSGVAIHTIDTGAHTWFQCDNPCTFMAVPDLVWELMYWRRGFINRFLPSEYIRWAESAGYAVKEFGRTFEVQDNPTLDTSTRHFWIKPQLLPRYRQASETDIFTRYIMLGMTPRASASTSTNASASTSTNASASTNATASASTNATA